jgi:acyl-CoA hydrolase
LPAATVGEIDKTIGAYVASLVNDGDTIQLGIGGIPNAVALAFMNKHDLGVHTEMITSSMAILAEAGVITGKKKSLHKGKMIGTFALGTQALYDFLDGNPAVQLLRGNYVNNPFVIAKNDNMVSINTALQVDLTGQVCSESIGLRTYSGSGGQNDTAEGAIHAKNGRSIIALYSTAKNGTISAIQPWLTPGAAVTLSRNNVDYIVTEYGIAPMKARTIKQRVENLIAIAHPDFRSELRALALKHEIW